MSRNDLPAKLTSVEKIVQRLVSAEKTNQKEIRLTIQEAREIVTDLSILTSKLGKHIEEIHQNLDKIEVAGAQVNVQMDGGTF
jgi:septation ring formation regulator EzrA